MRSLFKQPITWMVLGEVVVVAALVAVSWHVLAGGLHTVGSVTSPATVAPEDTAPPDESISVVNPPSPSAAPPLPGLNVDPAFWRLRLAALNDAEVQVEALEWRIVRSAMDTIHRYLETVVLPAVERAERGGG